MIDFINFLHFMLLQATEGTPGEGQAAPENQWMQWILIGGVVVVFYFFMLRPQQKKRKEEQQFRENLGKGDKIVTIGGIHGKISSVEENNSSALIEVDNGVKLRFDLAALKPAPEPQQSTESKK